MNKLIQIMEECQAIADRAKSDPNATEADRTFAMVSNLAAIAAGMSERIERLESRVVELERKAKEPPRVG